MPMTEPEKDRYANELADRLEALDPDTIDPSAWRDAAPLRAIASAQDEVPLARQRLTDTVLAARAAGFSWNVIAAVLGVSRQAARQRFGTPSERAGTQVASRH